MFVIRILFQAISYDQYRVKNLIIYETFNGTHEVQERKRWLFSHWRQLGLPETPRPGLKKVVSGLPDFLAAGELGRFKVPAKCGAVGGVW